MSSWPAALRAQSSAKRRSWIKHDFSWSLQALEFVESSIHAWSYLYAYLIFLMTECIAAHMHFNYTNYSLVMTYVEGKTGFASFCFAINVYTNMFSKSIHFFILRDVEWKCVCLCLSIIAKLYNIGNRAYLSTLKVLKLFIAWYIYYYVKMPALCNLLKKKKHTIGTEQHWSGSLSDMM